MLKTIRIILALICLVAITALFLDFTGTCAGWLGWLPKIQLIPAILSLNFIALIVLIVLSLIFGRIYCSVVCPLGVMQDVVNWIRGKVGKRKWRINRFKYNKPHTIVRIVILAAFVCLIILGLSSIAGLIEPYSEYGRIVSAFVAPGYDAVNNALADAAQAHDSVAFYHVSGPGWSTAVGLVAAVTLIVVVIFAWTTGRGYCNTICPAGTILGYLSQFSLLKPFIDKSTCNGCGKCARNCKASCIDPKNHTIDYTRCVTCMDCLGNCSTSSIRYGMPDRSQTEKDESRRVDNGRRQFLSVSALVAGAALAKAEDKTTDGGLAVLMPKEKPAKRSKIVPPGALSVKNLESHCTSCQLCVNACPNEVLSPSVNLSSFMQPEMSFEKGYCRPECVECSSACPAGAIRPIDVAEKSSIQIGHAIVNLSTCLSATGEASCGLCARKCPVQAIVMVPVDADNESSPLMPVVNDSQCIGCGKCENLCPVNPLSAIVVDGYEVHRRI